MGILNSLAMSASMLLTVSVGAAVSVKVSLRLVAGILTMLALNMLTA